VFDNNIDNSDDGIAKEDAILEMLDDYNKKYGTAFGLPNYGKYKKDVAKRLAHKKPYTNIEHDHSQQIDLLIVVTQMLTGYDSKWVNTLYVDKLMKYVDIIQAFSRTNRIFNKHEKPHGIIYYYTYPYTMEQNINDALDVYVDRPLGVFVDKLEGNLNNINSLFLHIRDIFQARGIMNFERLPDEDVDRKMFAKDFCQMARKIDAAKLQGFVWEKSEYEFKHGDTYTKVKMELDEQTFLVLLQRYRELFEGRERHEGGTVFEYPIDTYLTEKGTGTIDADYINSKFVKFIKRIYTEGPGSELTKEALKELHKTFASLPQKDQRTAILILHDIQSGDLRIENGKTIQDYINEYQLKELYEQMKILAEATGVNLSMLKNIMTAGVTEENIDEYNRFSDLRITIDNSKTKLFLEKITGKTIAPQFVMPRWSKVLKDFILDAEMREKILNAWLNEGVTIDSAEARTEDAEIEFEDLENPQQSTDSQEPNINYIKNKLIDIISFTLNDVGRNMRSNKEITDALMYVIDKETIDNLSGVGVFLHRAFINLYKQNATIVDKHVAFHLFATKFEAYLKKLYYLMKGEEVKPQNEGEKVTWKNVIHDVQCLWKLKFQLDDAHQRLFQYLLMVKEWRNEESHISPTASEQELDGAINIILTMYCYATGMCITDLEEAGHDIEEPIDYQSVAESGNSNDSDNSNEE
jgi:type I restriction enzyme R subunit